MKVSNPSRTIFAACFVLFATPSTSSAEIYKWVDEHGRTHYSENMGEAAKGKVTELKIKAPPPSASSANSSVPYAKNPGRPHNPYQAQGPKREQFQPPAFERQKSLSGGRLDESDQGKCNLARDILSGAVKHGNGAPIDANDRAIAESDVSSYCKK